MEGFALSRTFSITLTLFPWVPSHLVFHLISFNNTSCHVRWKIVTFAELPGSCHPTNQILTQIVVFVIFILFAVKLAPYYPSCHCTRPFLVIFVKIVLLDVFAVKFAPCHPSSHFTAWFFVVFVKILFLVSFVGVFGPLLCTKPWLHSAIFCNFRQNRWALSSHLSVLSESLEPLMPHAIALSNF